MKKLILLAAIAAFIWQSAVKHQEESVGRTQTPTPDSTASEAQETQPVSPPAPDTQRSKYASEASQMPPASPWPALPANPARQFQCDGRTHCSQMTSCEEATFFLKNCPGVKMDGDNDGVPCESQWCN